MTNRLRILIVEDIEQDVELILYQLRKEEINFVHSHAKNKSEYIKSLNSFNADIILSDYNMPSFTGIDALQIAKENFSEIPFIIVTGSINEEIAVDCIKQGAWDYVIKEHIVRLVPALKNALKLKDQKLEKHKAQSKLIKSELKYRLIACNINDMISKHNLEGEFEFVSPSSYNLLGYEPNELTGRSIYDFSHPDDIEIIKANHSQIIESFHPIIMEYRLKNANGNYLWVEMSASAFINDEENFSGEILCITRNIQERKTEEIVRGAVYNIGQAVVKSCKQEELFAEINHELQNIFPDSNFYIAIYNSDKHSFEYPSKNLQPPSANKILCSECVLDYIIREEISAVFSQNDLKELKEKGRIKDYNPQCLTCMGVPLRINGRISGGIIVQNTHKIDAFSEKDLKLMGFIASQIGISILGRHNEERLIHSKEKAEESDRLKSAFLANMSHEIRTPMNSILGFSDLLSHYPMDKEQKKYITHIKESGVLLLNLINDIIDLSKIEAGQLSLNIQTFSVKKLLEDLFVSFDEHIKRSEKTRLRIVLATIEQDYFIQSDLLRLKQILSNFISNAIKYSKKGIITIGVEKSNKNIFRFYVKDTGIGIPSNKLDSIFERFHKIDNTEILGGGTGLGLSICKSLAEGLKGNINVKSELGIGSVFSIDLPYVQSSTTQHEIIADKNTLLSDFSNKTILIVEDDESSYFYFASTLKTTGANIIWVMDGFKAIEICKNNFSVDLILMDIRLPKLSGYAATKEIKAMHPNLPIIAQTAYAMPGEKQKCFDAGCDDYLTKPILPNDLIMSIAGFIGKNERK